MTTRPLMQAALLSALVLPVGAAVAADSNPLTAERWKTRPVVVVVPEPEDPLLRKVRATLDDTKGREAFREREMALYTVVAGRGSRNGQALDASQTTVLLRALQLDARGPAAFVLVGKDGGVKLRAGADADLQEVFREIDRMPMRQPR